MLEVMIGLALAMAPAWEPGPNDPVCEPGQVVEVDHCAQGQLPGERIGRETGDGPYPPAYEQPPTPATTPAASAPAAPPIELAFTGVQEWPTAIVAALLMVGGSGLVLIARRGQAHGR